MLTPRQTLNKAYLKVKPSRNQIEGFKTHLKALLDGIDDAKREEYHKTLLTDFLKKAHYDGQYFVNVKDDVDLAIHTGQKPDSAVAVLLEVKKPSNAAEMPKVGKLNSKALQELVLYYLRERITHNNLEVKHLIITNIREWFVFDAQSFDRLFAQNKGLVKQFTDFEAGRLSESKTDFFYKQIAEPFIATLQNDLPYTWFELAAYEKALRNTDKTDDNKLIALYKLLSPEHLLKLPFANDSNSLDKRFYSELLHIIGLTEVKDGGKKLIQRNKAGERHSGSLLEDAIIQLDSLDKLSRLDRNGQAYGANTQDRLFNVALELVITWVNRILFLKLLEAQLLSYQKGDKSYAFLNSDKIKSYDDLNSLFFQVLARSYEERNDDVAKLFDKVPYLNSSLFEPTELEQLTLFISNLRDDKQMPVHSQTVLKDEQGRKRNGSMGALAYLFAFLDAYDFGAEGSEDIQEDNKTLINASVLGLIFEKINGYKDGSFFTPGFITMYMCRETIRKAVLQKFNEAATPLLRGAGGVSSGAGGVSQGAIGVSNDALRKTPSVAPRTIIPYNPRLKLLARELRNNSTKTEIMLWKELKGKFAGKYDFHRQKPLDNYIADFFCYELKLVIELDGITHEWEETQKKDFIKECRLNELGLNVLRFDDDEVYDHFEQVLQTIRDYVAGFEKGDLSDFQREDTPLNPLSRAEFVVSTPANLVAQEDTPLNPLSRGDLKDHSDVDGGTNAAFFKSLDDVYEQIGDNRMFTRHQANNIVNSIKICDPAVGSGHFLVSALNEMIAVKNDLKILQDRNGRRLKEYQVEVVNDELIVTDSEGELFEYNPRHAESQRIQETLFHEKQTLIENCLFGVDINPNSVKICRLRLWIELLKNAYYKTDATAPAPLLRGAGGVLETLPNIDINIKTGNSLVSRFALDADLKQALRKSKFSIDAYRIAVATYRNAESKEQKREMERLIAHIKSDFRSEIAANDPKIKRLQKLEYDYGLLVAPNMFREDAAAYGTKANQKKAKEREGKMLADINKLKAEIEEIKANKIYENAFEWRFEFPEVLNDEGDFVGFDVLIGNPPYIRQEEFTELKPYLQVNYPETAQGTADLFVYFVELSMRVLKHSGEFSFIIPNKWMRAGYGKKLREFIAKKHIEILVDFGDLPVFEEATTYPNIVHLNKSAAQPMFVACNVNSLDFPEGLDKYLQENRIEIKLHELSADGWTLTNSEVQSVLTKLKGTGMPLSEYVKGKIFRGVLTGYNEAFVIDESTKNQLIANDAKSAEIIKPFLAGRDIKRYQTPKADKYLIFTRRGIDIENYSAVLAYLSQFRTRLEPKPKNHKGDWEGRKEGSYKWYEIQDSVDYFREFDSPKIIYPNICKWPEFTYDESRLYTNQKCFIITQFTLTFLGIINSKLYFFLFQAILPKLRGDFYEPSYVYFKDFPVVNKESPLIESLVKRCLAQKSQNPAADTTALEAEIDQLVYALYGLTEEEIKIVEGV